MIKIFVDWFLSRVLKVVPHTFFSEALSFFLYDTIKIFLLLAIIIFLISFIRTFFPAERTRKILSHEKKYIGNIVAALLGIMTPFCSCSAVPLFLGFVEAGVPLGITFSFLVSSPMINEVALVMLWGMFGYKVALIYIGSGLVIAIFSGIIIDKLKVEGLLENLTQRKEGMFFSSLLATPLFKDRIKLAGYCTYDIIRKIWLFVLIGIGIGAWIHGYVPSDFLAKYAGKNNWFAVPVATLIGIPLYSNAAGVIPLVSALTEKGVGMGTALAFMMAVTGLSLPEFLILKRVMKIRLILIFSAVVGAGIIFTGYLFNFIIH
ncbi:MAG: permease [Candidatus Omnitrophica bacterium]|nr:permease [Candidatus Omnitrophota bacterium]MDD5610540.1 permease [Candidatus Omnitrophota bacterium]